MQHYKIDYMTCNVYRYIGIEEIVFIAGENGREDHYWAVRDSDRCLWHERYIETGTGEEGDLDELEPDQFDDPTQIVPTPGTANVVAYGPPQPFDDGTGGEGYISRDADLLHSDSESGTDSDEDENDDEVMDMRRLQ